MRQILSDKLTDLASQDETIEWLINQCGLERTGAQQLVNYILQGRDVLGAVPTQQTLIAERFFDEGGGMQLVIHSPFGARINKAWGLALRKRFCRSFNFELQAAATDDGLNISLAEQHSFPLGDVFQFLHPNTLKEVLVQAVLESPLFKIRWRWAATRALALLRFRGGKKVPPNIQRMLADDLLAAVFPDAAACQDNLAGEDIKLPDHPLTNETMKDALTEALDVDGLLSLITNILNHSIICKAVDTPLPSVFSHEILNANPYAFLDDAPLEERRARAVNMRRTLPQSVLEEVGKLDPFAIEEVKRQAWPDLRSADELHDLMQTVIALPIQHEWTLLYETLAQENRATVANQLYWVAAEKVADFNLIYPQALWDKALPIFLASVTDRAEAINNMVRGWMLHLGPTSAKTLSNMLALSLDEINQALLNLENSGFILRGYFGTFSEEQTQWCERRLLARIHRLTVETLRKQIQPVSPEQFMHWLLNWQHLAPGHQLSGEQGLIQIIEQLQGYECPANVWEKQIFQKRLSDYDPYLLDRICLMGLVGWGRLSSHPATLEVEDDKKIIPRSNTPITFFMRENLKWLLQNREDIEPSLSHVAQEILRYLKQHGASFMTDILYGVARLQAEVENGLWELVSAGAITSDGFDNLRALIDPKRRSDRNRRRVHFRFSTGRWSLLPMPQVQDPQQQLEAICWMLLKRYGVVFRDLLLREKNLPRWRDILITLRRLEDRGEIRGGRFVSGFVGEQFALPYAIESLRSMKNEASLVDDFAISAAEQILILPNRFTKIII